ncbi:MAG: PAS domain-containing sensor histidine kinase [Alphaproteobacteria bacterium]
MIKSKKAEINIKPIPKADPKLKALLNFSMETIILINNDGIVETINDAGLKTFNVTEKQIVGENIDFFLPSETSKIHQRIFNIIKSSKKKFTINYFYKNKWFDCLYSPIINDNDEIDGIAIYARDITKDKNTAEVLRKTIERLTTAERITHLGYWEWDMLNNKIFWSQEMFNIFELSPEDFIPNYKKTLSFIHPNDLLYFKNSIKNLPEQNNKQFLFRIITATGKIKHLQSNIISEIEDKTKKQLIFGTLIDITNQKKEEIKLKKSKEESEKANKEKTRFLASASHDIRQPLHAMELLIKTLAETILEQKSQNIVSKLSMSLSNLATLIDNLLDISQIDVGKVKPNKFVFSLDIIKSSLAEEFRVLASQKNIIIKNIPSSATIYSDPILIERILRNLVGNAVKYTDKGKIIIGCRKKGDKIRIEIHDSGQGIAEEKQNLIFKEFEQINLGEIQKSKGFGLGLYIVKNLADILKTEVKIKSKLGQGSCFYFDVETNPKQCTKSNC